jgi:hypothetical protein
MHFTKAVQGDGLAVVHAPYCDAPRASRPGLGSS